MTRWVRETDKHRENDKQKERERKTRNENKLVFQSCHFCSSLSEIVYQWMEPVNNSRENKQWSFSRTSRNWHKGLCENPWCAFHWIPSKSNSCIAVNRQWRRYRQEWSHPPTTHTHKQCHMKYMELLQFYQIRFCSDVLSFTVL